MKGHPNHEQLIGVLAHIRKEACRVQHNKSTRAAKLIAEIIGTKQVRRGSKPTAESVMNMTGVIEKCIDSARPIPFMCPWGSEKPDGSGIDVAEAGAIAMIGNLNQRVKTHYPPGITCHIRVEDVSAPHLFFDRADDARREAKRYSDSLAQLPRAMGVDCVVIKRESAMISEADFNAAADAILPLMEAHLHNVHCAHTFAKLKNAGWRSAVTPAMMDEYLGRYNLLYPDKTEKQRLHVLARYFSAVLVRYQLGLRGDDPSWGGEFLDISFVEPSRTTDFVFPRRVYYRTVPSSQCSNHVPPWRAKGFVEISSHTGEARLCLSCFRHKPDLHEAAMRISGSGSSVEVRCDWRIQ